MTPILHSGPGIIIGIPTLGRPVPLDWALSFKGMNPPINFNSIFQVVHGQEVGAARQAIAEFAVEKKAKYLFFIGDDVVCPAHTLRQLIFRLDQDPTIGVVGGVYCAKADPANPLVFRGNGQGAYWDWKIGEFFEVTGLGMDCTLIRVDILEKISKPWFQTVDTDQFIDGKNNAESWTEDLYFFKKLAEETSYKVYCDAGVICEHWDVYGNKKYTLPPESLPMRQRAVTKTKKGLFVGRREDFDKLTPTEPDFDFIHCDTTEDVNDGYRIGVGQLPFADHEFDWIVGTDMGLNTNVSEFVRVCKSGGKISLAYHPLINRDKLIQVIPAAHVAGDYIEMNKVG